MQSNTRSKDGYTKGHLRLNPWNGPRHSDEGSGHDGLMTWAAAHVS